MYYVLSIEYNSMIVYGLAVCTVELIALDALTTFLLVRFLPCGMTVCMVVYAPFSPGFIALNR
jgi:hypothetical protein